MKLPKRPNKTYATIGDWMRRTFSIGTLPAGLDENMYALIGCLVLAGIGDLIERIYK